MRESIRAAAAVGAMLVVAATVMACSTPPSVWVMTSMSVVVDSDLKFEMGNTYDFPGPGSSSFTP